MTTTDSPIFCNCNTFRSIDIDDFALKKRYCYGTVFVNNETNQIISMTLSWDSSGNIAIETMKFHN